MILKADNGAEKRGEQSPRFCLSKTRTSAQGRNRGTPARVFRARGFPHTHIYSPWDWLVNRRLARTQIVRARFPRLRACPSEVVSVRGFSSFLGTIVLSPLSDGFPYKGNGTPGRGAVLAGEERESVKLRPLYKGLWVIKRFRLRSVHRR